jgi:hypothetical protein
MVIYGDTKAWWQSRAVVGGIVAVFAGVFGLADNETKQLTDLIDNELAFVGGLLAIYGRVRATKTIK